MNLASFLIVAVVAALFVLSVRYLHKNGLCASCSDSKSCGGHCSGHCAGGCSGCAHHAQVGTAHSAS